MQLFILLCAALSYSIGGYFMKLSDGLNRGGPMTAVMILFCLGAGLQMYAMRNTEMTITYVIVLGFEAITATAIGALLLHETFSLTKFLGVLVVVLGVALLRA
jgi:small multidrug resistance pump/quaternary ammonium compound-resistance protein SugE